MIIITVTQEDLDRSASRIQECATGGVCINCPVAVALQRHFYPKFQKAWTDGGHMGLFDGSYARGLRLPKHMETWVANYDLAVGQRSGLIDNRDLASFPDVPVEFEIPDIYVRWMEDILALSAEAISELGGNG